MSFYSKPKLANHATRHNFLAIFHFSFYSCLEACSSTAELAGFVLSSYCFLCGATRTHPDEDLWTKFCPTRPRNEYLLAFWLGFSRVHLPFVTHCSRLNFFERRKVT